MLREETNKKLFILTGLNHAQQASFEGYRLGGCSGLEVGWSKRDGCKSSSSSTSSKCVPKLGFMVLVEGVSPCG